MVPSAIVTDDEDKAIYFGLTGYHFEPEIFRNHALVVVNDTCKDLNIYELLVQRVEFSEVKQGYLKSIPYCEHYTNTDFSDKWCKGAQKYTYIGLLN